MSYLQTVKTYVDKFYLVNKQKRGVGADLRPRGVWSPGLEIVKNWVLSLSEKFFGWGGDIAKEEAERFAEMVRQAVYSQRYKWVPLSQKYLEWKRRTGRDSRILVATREYVESIRIVRNEVGSWHESEKVVFYEVGLPTSFTWSRVSLFVSWRLSMSLECRPGAYRLALCADLYGRNSRAPPKRR